MNEIPKPKTLYKFRSWNNEHHKTLLTERKLWVPTAAELNDPFDCCIPLRYDRLTDRELKRRFERLLPKEIGRERKRELARQIIRELGFRDQDTVRTLLEQFA